MKDIYKSPFEEVFFDNDAVTESVERACSKIEYIQRIEKNFFFNNQTAEDKKDNSIKAIYNKIKMPKKEVLNFDFFKPKEGLNEIKFITHKLVSYKNVWLENKDTDNSSDELVMKSFSSLPLRNRLLINDNCKEFEEKLVALGHRVSQGYSTYVLDINDRGKIFIYEMPYLVFSQSDMIIDSINNDKSIIIRYNRGERYNSYQLILGDYCPLGDDDKKMIREMLLNKKDKIKEYYDRKISSQVNDVIDIIKNGELKIQNIDSES